MAESTASKTSSSRYRRPDAAVAALAHDLGRDLARDLAADPRPPDRARPRRAAPGETISARVSGREQEHLVGDLARLGHDRAEAHAGEDEHVVGLADDVVVAVHADRLERAAGRDEGPAVRSRPGCRPGSASVLAVGFESGKMTGRSAWAAISRIAASVNAPAHAARPDEHRRLDRGDDGLQVEPIGRRQAARSRRSSARRAASANSRLSSSSWSRVVEDQALRVDRDDRALGGGGVQALGHHAPRGPVRAMPMPAAPAPRKTKRCSPSGRPRARTAARMPARTTAPVPWMSSLKLVMRWR